MRKIIGYGLLSFAALVILGPVIYLFKFWGIGAFAFAFALTAIVVKGCKLVDEE